MHWKKALLQIDVTDDGIKYVVPSSFDRYWRKVCKSFVNKMQISDAWILLESTTNDSNLFRLPNDPWGVNMTDDEIL